MNTIIHVFYYNLFCLLKHTFICTLLIFSPIFLYDSYDSSFQITKTHFQFFLLISFVMFFRIIFVLNISKQPPKLTKLDKRYLKKMDKKNKKRKKKYGTKLFFKRLCVTFLFYFFENILLIRVLIELTMIMYCPLLYKRILIYELAQKKITHFLIKNYTPFLKPENILHPQLVSNFENLKLINLRIKNNLNKDGRFIQIHPYSSIKILKKMIETIYDPNDINNIRYKGKSLTGENVQDLNLWDDYQMHNHSEIEVIFEILRGGAKKKKIFKRFECSGCLVEHLGNQLCKHNFCKNCRKKNPNCNCCGHDRCKRCPHGFCYRSCIDKDFCLDAKKCSCFDKARRERRDYNDKTQQKQTLRKNKSAPNFNKNICTPPSSPPPFSPPPFGPPRPSTIYPSFPILNHGTRNQFPHLSEHQWLSFQCILFWDYCKAHELNVNPSMTFFFFFKNNIHNIKQNFTDDHVNNLWRMYCQKLISIENYLQNFQTSPQEFVQSIDLKKQLITPLVKQIILFHNDHPQFSLSKVLEEVVFSLHEKDPWYVEESIIHPVLLQFSINSLKSTSKVLDLVKNNTNLTLRQKNDYLHKVLFANFFDGADQMEKNEVRKLFNVTDHLFNKSLRHIDDFKNGITQSFDPEVKGKKIYSDATFELMRLYWQNESIPWEGAKIATRRLQNGEKETHPVHFMPKPFAEHYEYFCLHPDYGGKCRTILNNKHKIPGETLFRECKPFYIRPHPEVRTGYCPICMKMKAQLATFRKIVKKACKCHMNCSNFVHHNDCSRILNIENQCTQCEECFCEKCDECKVPKFTNSVSEFLNCLNCKQNKIGPDNYPTIDCILNVKKKTTCDECRMPNYKNMLNRICPTAFENIDETSNVTTKDWNKKKVVETSTSRYKVHVLEKKVVNVVTFLKTFHTFLTQKRGFIWHFHVKNLQRFHYNQMITNMQNGIYGDSVLMILVDWAENYTIKDSKKLSAAQFFTTKKCQIHGLVEFFYLNKFDSCSNFKLSDQNIHKNSPNSISDIKILIEAQKLKNKNLSVVHIWSDGSTKEFLNRNTFGNMLKISKELNVAIVWNYFANNHGKNLCDSEFARWKQKMKREFLRAVHAFGRCAKGICEFFETILSKWQCNGNQVKTRKVDVRDNNEESFMNYKPVSDVKLYRCVMWTPNGKFYRKNNSCSCKQCVTKAEFTLPCEKYENLAGCWELTPLFENPLESELTVESVKSMKVIELKTELTSRNLSVKGLKKDLQTRLKDFLSYKSSEPENSDSPKPESSYLSESENSSLSESENSYLSESEDYSYLSESEDSYLSESEDSDLSESENPDEDSDLEVMSGDEN
jgi:hypothetical protein